MAAATANRQDRLWRHAPAHERRRRGVFSLCQVLSLCLVLALTATACRAGDDATIERSAERTTSQTPDAADTNETDPSETTVAASDDAADSDADTNDAGSSQGSTAQPGQTIEQPTLPPSGLPRDLDLTSVDCSAPSVESTDSLTDLGRRIFVDYLDSGIDVPTYELAVDINPASGEVAGAMRAVIPAQQRTINFRVFAGMEAFEAGLTIDDVTVNGEAVDATVDRALLSLPAPLTTDATNVIELTFGFTIDQMAANDDIFGALTGESLQPDQVGLLGRTDTGMQLGHWFPVWLPDGIRTDPDPSGFGDIGAFPAATICATITVPPGYQVVTGGAWVATTDTSIIEAGVGLRDFSILISNDLLLATGFVEGVEIRVWGPAENPSALMTVLGYAEQSLTTLTEAFGPYPWKEIDIISAPLGAGVGGMEWPGAIWIEQSMFAGGLPGLGDLGSVFGEDELGALLEAAGGAALTTSLEWTVAHEMGHEWWHATVGNDSIESPAVDEPLAQFSACLVMEEIHPDNWREICDAQTVDQYAQARSLGVNDTAAEQASDEFESSLQYGAIVYGKAPGFYYTAGDLIGWDKLIAALRSFVDENAFALVSTNSLRSHLVDAAGADGPQIADLWDRWFRQAKGDEDIDQSDLFGTLGGFDGLEDVDLDQLFGEDFNLEELFGEGFDLEELLGEDFDFEGLLGEGADIGDLLQDFVDATEGD